MSVPNQKIIQVQKAPCNKNNLYCTINLEALQQAMSELSGAGLALWLYLSKNQNGYSLELSPADATSWGIKKSSFYRAIDELTKLGYIRYLKGNVFTFYENPSPKMELIKSQNETQKNQVPKWDLDLMGSPKMGLGKSQNETRQSQNEYRNITNITDNTQAAKAAACNITGENNTTAAATSPHREEVEEAFNF